MAGILGSSSSHCVGRFAKYGRNGDSQKQNKSIQRCQKCLEYGHYTFECKNEAAYAARPSRTQQLKNPKLRQGFLSASDLPPSLNSDGREDESKKKERKKRKKSPSPSSSSSDSKSSSSGGSSSGGSSSGGSSSSGNGSSSKDGDTSTSSSSDSESGGDKRKKRHRILHFQK